MIGFKADLVKSDAIYRVRPVRSARIPLLSANRETDVSEFALSAFSRQLSAKY